MDIKKNQIQESFEKLYVKNAPDWSLERDQDGGYKYHATQSAFLLFEEQQIEIDLLKAELAKAQAVPYEPGSFKSSHEIIINETKSELIDGYDIAKKDEYLLESLVYRGVCIGKAQAVPEGFVLVPTKNVKYFSNDGENYKIHDTLAEAKHEAECAIEHFSECLADQLCDPRDDGNFQDVGYGVILAQSAYSLDHVVIQEDIDRGDYSYDVGTEIMSLFLVEAQERSHD